MKNIIRFFFLVATFAFLVMPACGNKNALTTHYLLNVRINPSSGGIECKIKIQHPPDSLFYLNQNLKIRRITADGRTVSFHRKSFSKPLPYSVGTAVVVEANAREELLVEYSGFLTEVINNVNMVNSDLVELAYYAAWFPIFQGNNLFNFTLNADLPSDFITTSNGILEHQQQRQGRNITQWASFKPDFDIVLLASPHLQKVGDDQKNTKVEMYFSKTPREYIMTKKESLMKGMVQLTNFYGPPRVKGYLRFVYSPRSGWGYSRIPLFVVSEEYALKQQQEEFGQARDFHGATHEMAHFWWNIADANTPDDWINEGLAEFSAFRLSEKFSGRDFTDQLVNEYREHAAHSVTETSIVETETSSPDRYVNRYEKTTLLLIEARRRFGSNELDGVLKALHTRFAGTRNATTGLFLEEVEKQLGIEAKSFFSEALFSKK
ncbi:MAG TPA: hypothetical protein VMZ04_01415 [Anaerolineae bacterium]|nr:hypothetical protein [Anaerolineae bacterium]